MCLIALAVGVSNEYALVLAANRDERHARPTAPASWWSDTPAILAGRDLVAGGTWLGVDRTGRVAALTNIYEPDRPPAPRSRGELVASFLQNRARASEFGAALRLTLDRYSAFNLLLYDGKELAHLSNRAPPLVLGPGIHVLSNSVSADDWPKVRRARAAVGDWLAGSASVEAVLDFLAERAPQRATREYYREAIFVEGTEYGTRCSTVLTIARTGAVVFIERRFDAAGRATGEDRYDFELEAASSVRSALSAGDP